MAAGPTHGTRPSESCEKTHKPMHARTSATPRPTEIPTVRPACSAGAVLAAVASPQTPPPPPPSSSAMVLTLDATGDRVRRPSEGVCGWCSSGRGTTWGQVRTPRSDLRNGFLNQTPCCSLARPCPECRCIGVHVGWRWNRRRTFWRDTEPAPDVSRRFVESRLLLFPQGIASRAVAGSRAMSVPLVLGLGLLLLCHH